jgi:hypothetical protein
MATMNRAARALVILLLLTSCASARVKTTPKDETSHDPATSSAVTAGTPSSSNAPTSTTSFVPAPGVRCPAPPFVYPNRDEAATEAFGAEQGLLRDDQHIVQEYLSAHLGDTFELQYSPDSPARIEMRASDHFEEHRAAIAKLLAHPEHVEVIKVDYAPADVRRVAIELLAEAQARPGVFSSYSGGGEEAGRQFQLIAELAPGQEALAAELVGRWGPIVQM